MTISKLAVIACAALLAAAAPEEALRRNEIDPRALQTVYQCVRAANFREVRGFTAVGFEGGRYRFTAEKSASVVYFRSRQLDELKRSVGNDSFFSDLLKNAAAYCVFGETKALKDASGAVKNWSIYDAHVLIIEHGRGPDEITVVCMADRN